MEKNKTGVKLKSFCRKHSDEKQREKHNNSSSNSSSGSIIQEIDLVINPESSLENNNLEFWQYVDLATLSKQLLGTIKDDYPTLSAKTHQLYLDLIYQYWKIKRYSQFGAPLIKITTSSSLEEMQLQQRIEVLRLRVDLERIRNLSYMLIKREKLKKTWLNTHKSLIDKSLEIAERINSVNTLNLLKNIYKPESPTQNAEFQHHLRILENLNTIHDTIDINNIYNSASNEMNKVKLILKRLNRLSKIEKTNEILNARNPSNPYARSFKRRDEDTDSYSSDQPIKCERFDKNERCERSTANGHHPAGVKHTPNDNHMRRNNSYPLKSKSIPSNLKNSTHHTTGHHPNMSVHEIQYNQNSNSKLYAAAESPKNSVKKSLVRPNSVTKVCKKMRSSPKL